MNKKFRFKGEYIKKKEVNESFRRKMDQNVGKNKKVYGKEVDKINGEERWKVPLE